MTVNLPTHLIFHLFDGIRETKEFKKAVTMAVHSLIQLNESKFLEMIEKNLEEECLLLKDRLENTKDALEWIKPLHERL